MPTQNLRQKLRAAKTIQQVYDCIPPIECKQKCQDCCGPILMTKPEWDKIKAHLGHTPKGTPCLTCPMLAPNGKCTIHHIRPAICRLYGTTPSMRCEHGCKPHQHLSDNEGHMILNRIEQIADKITKQSENPNA